LSLSDIQFYFSAPHKNPPLHLALGNDALGVMRKKIASLQQDIYAWEATLHQL